MQLMSPVTRRAAQHRGIREAPPRSTRGAPGEERGAQEAGEGAALPQGGDGDGDWLGAGAGPELWLGGRRGLRGAGSRLGVGVGRGGASLLPAGTRRPDHTWPASSQDRVRPPRLPPPPACHRRLGPPSPTCGSALRHLSLSSREGRGPGDPTSSGRHDPVGLAQALGAQLGHSGPPFGEPPYVPGAEIKWTGRASRLDDSSKTLTFCLSQEATPASI